MSCTVEFAIIISYFKFQFQFAGAWNQTRDAWLNQSSNGTIGWDGRVDPHWVPASLLHGRVGASGRFTVGASPTASAIPA